MVQIIGPADGWVLEKLARILAAKLPYAEFVPWHPRPGSTTKLAYYVNYALYHGPSGLVDVGFFTHHDEEQQFLPRARRLDYCVSMSRLYADWLLAHGIQHVEHIPIGCDYYRYQPRLVLAVVGKLDHPRKGRHLVKRLAELPFVEIVATEGKVSEDQLRDVYQRADYVLIPSTVEGGPQCLLEGLAIGKAVIAPDGVGLVPEFGVSPWLLRYPAGDGAALEGLVRACFERKRSSTRLVQDRTWDRWAEDHHHLFSRLLAELGSPLPQPAPGFHFGLLAELDIPWKVDVGHLEQVIDQAAAHLYFGEYAQVRTTLQELLPRYPFVQKLLQTIPREAA
jgi:glycosyltransferase involved in cell wall biosynthesis